MPQGNGDDPFRQSDEPEDELESLDQDLLLELQLDEYKRTKRLQRQLLSDAMIPRQKRGRVVPIEETRQIRMNFLQLESEMLNFELLEFFIDVLPEFMRKPAIQGYRLDFLSQVTVLMMAGKKQAWIHFRDEYAGTYFTFFWHLESEIRIRAFDQIYATVEEAIELIHGGIDGIERGYQFLPDKDVTYPFSGSRPD
jgi:hypothetical protein